MHCISFCHSLSATIYLTRSATHFISRPLQFSLFSTGAKKAYNLNTVILFVPRFVCIRRDLKKTQQLFYLCSVAAYSSKFNSIPHGSSAPAAFAPIKRAWRGGGKKTSTKNKRANEIMYIRFKQAKIPSRWMLSIFLQNIFVKCWAKKASATHLNSAMPPRHVDCK